MAQKPTETPETPPTTPTPETPAIQEAQEKKVEKEFQVKGSVITEQVKVLQEQLQKLQQECLQNEKIANQIAKKLEINQAQQNFTVGSIRALEALVLEQGEK